MRHVGATVLAVFAASCLEAPQLAPCGDDWCLTGTTCFNDRCATNAQIEACAGAADAAGCTFDGAVGRCSGGVCLIEGCGNRILDGIEVCDDGNTDSGDGCRADCAKMEVCGDGEIDEGEPCDDGNTNPVDLCDACVSTFWEPTTFVGGKTPSVEVPLSNPGGLAIDRAGNQYIADTGHHRIRRVDAETGLTTVVAGVGVVGFAGDDGPATSAKLNGPEGLAIDGLGNLYVADKNNHRIRRVDGGTGVITTIAGTGTAAYSGDTGPATSAALSSPEGVAVDGLGTLYIADRSNHRIRAIDPVTGVITTIAGTGTSGSTGDGGLATDALLSSPRAVLVDAFNNVLIADTSNHRIRVVAAGTGRITTIAGTTFGDSGDGGPAISAQLASPVGIAVDASRNLFITDANHRIRRVAGGIATGMITTVAGNGTAGFSGDGGQATMAVLSGPRGLAVDAASTIYVADVRNHRVRGIDGTGLIRTVAGGTTTSTGDGGSATASAIDPSAVAVDGQGNFYVADRNNHRVRRIEATTGVITTVAGTGIAGSFGDNVPATSATLDSPFGVAVDGSGNLFIADTNNNRIRRVDAGGTITTVAATVGILSNPSGVAVDAAGNLYIADTANNRIRRVDAMGTITTVAGTTGAAGYSGDSGPATSAQLNFPEDVAVDGAGTLYIADTLNHRVRRVAGGVISTVAGTGVAGFSDGVASAAQLSSPDGVAVDGAGNLYIADRSNHRIRRVTAGVVTTIAGTGGLVFSGDGGPATTATLPAPNGVAADAAGNLWIADRTCVPGVIRRVDAVTGGITSVAGQIDPDGMGPLGLLARAQLADPRAMIITPQITLVAGGTSGTIQALRGGRAEALVGRYPHAAATAGLARFRDTNFGTISGVAFDEAANKIYLTEATANQLHVVTMIVPADPATWTIAKVNTSSAPGYRDGALANALFRQPTGLHLDASTKTLYVADTGNHAVRAINLTTATVSTIAGQGQTRGFFGDGMPATNALLYEPRALVRCANGDLFIADTGNHRIRRVTVTNTITTILGDGVAASSGEGSPANTFPVESPLGLACDGLGNLFASSTNTVRLLPADPTGVVDGTGPVQTIYGAAPRRTFPSSVTRCLTGLQPVNPTTLHVADSCTGIVIELVRKPVQ